MYSGFRKSYMCSVFIAYSRFGINADFTSGGHKHPLIWGLWSNRWPDIQRSTKLSREVLGIENLLEPQASLSPLTFSLPTPFPPSLPYQAITHTSSPPPLSFSSHLLLVISSQNAIGQICRPFPFSYICFTLFTFPSASCWIFLLLLTGFLAIFIVVSRISIPDGFRGNLNPEN